MANSASPPYHPLHPYVPTRRCSRISSLSSPQFKPTSPCGILATQDDLNLCTSSPDYLCTVVHALPLDTQENYKDFRSDSKEESRRRDHWRRWRWGKNAPRRYKMANWSSLLNEVGSEMYLEKEAWKNGSAWWPCTPRLFDSATAADKESKMEADEDDLVTRNRRLKRKKATKQNIPSNDNSSITTKTNRVNRASRIPTIQNKMDLAIPPNLLYPRPQGGYPSLSHLGARKRFLYRKITANNTTPAMCQCPMCLDIWQENWRENELFAELQFIAEGGLFERWGRGGTIGMDELSGEGQETEIETLPTRQGVWDCLVDKALERWEGKRKNEAERSGWEWFENRKRGLQDDLYSTISETESQWDKSESGSIWSFVDKESLEDARGETKIVIDHESDEADWRIL